MALYVSGTRPSAAPQAGQDAEATPWWETRYGRWRLDVEIEAMQRFPEFRLCGRHGDLAWVGELRSTLNATSSRSRIRATFRTRLQ